MYINNSGHMTKMAAKNRKKKHLKLENVFMKHYIIMPPTGKSLSRCKNVQKMTKFKL